VGLTSAPGTQEETAELLAAASAAGRRLRPVGGGTRSRRGRPGDAEPLSTSRLTRVVDHLPADLTVTVEAGMGAEALADLVGSASQCWPQADIRPGSTVGGVLATAASGRGRLRYGPVRDSLLEVVLATGDGRLIKGGGRTVKNVSGYDIPRLAVGSHGTLGVIVQVTLKLWPVPPASGWYAAEGATEERLALGARLLAELHRPAAVLLTPGRLSVRLDGYPDDVTAPEGTDAADAPPHLAGAGLVQVGVPPPALVPLVRDLEDQGRSYEAALGVGSCLVAVETPEDVDAVRALVRDRDGHAVVVDGPDELRADPWGPPPAGVEIMRRLKLAFDPQGVLAPGLAVWE
jgi:glycolate oxidase FAD binding subunit